MKQHYYSFTFIDTSAGQTAWASVYAGFEDQTINIAQIAYAKEGAKVSQGATLINCSYLGHMTSEYFNQAK